MTNEPRIELRPSSSQRWIHCSGSARAEAGLPHVADMYNQEGTLAHTVAAMLLANNMDYTEVISSLKLTQENLYSEMLPAIRMYTVYLDLFRNADPDQDFYIEREVDISHIIPGGSGTVDAISISEHTLHIFDFKYGKGIWVPAEENTQLLLYASGAYREFLYNRKIKYITMHIVQPRILNIDSWTIEPSDLQYWEGYIKAKAEDAMKPGVPRTPHSSACTFCRAAPTCPALYNFLNEVITTEARQSLTDEQIVHVLENEDLVKRFLVKVRESAYERLLQGQRINGLKLVEGIVRRRLKDGAADMLPALIGEAAYRKTPIGVTELARLVDSQTLETLVEAYRCKPSMVKANDKKAEMYREELQF